MKARRQRQPAQQNQQSHQHHQGRGCPDRFAASSPTATPAAGTDILQPAHQRPGGAGEEREGFHRAAGRQRKQHPRQKKRTARREPAGSRRSSRPAGQGSTSAPRQQAANHRLPHRRREAFVRPAGKPGAKERRRDRQNKQNADRHTAQTSTAPISTPEQASNTAMPARPPISISR